MIMLDKPMPSNCRECTFRINKVDVFWRCGALQGRSVNAKAYGTEKKRPYFCPLREPYRISSIYVGIDGKAVQIYPNNELNNH